MSKKNIKINSKNIKSNEEVDVIKFVKILCIVIGFCLIIYVVTILLQKGGVFDEGYKKLDSVDAVITHEDILIGSVFNRSQSEYYVAFIDDKTSDGQFLQNIINNYLKQDNVKAIYKVDMNSHFSLEHKSDEGNKGANSVENLKINGATLIKISNGNIITYLEGTDLIYDELIKK
ncbi:MAG: hypothetical protein RSB41_03215 [Bacilli bacterium]